MTAWYEISLTRNISFFQNCFCLSIIWNAFRFSDDFMFTISYKISGGITAPQKLGYWSLGYEEVILKRNFQTHYADL